MKSFTVLLTSLLVCVHSPYIFVYGSRATTWRNRLQPCYGPKEGCWVKKISLREKLASLVKVSSTNKTNTKYTSASGHVGQGLEYERSTEGRGLWGEEAQCSPRATTNISGPDVPHRCFKPSRTLTEDIAASQGSTDHRLRTTGIKEKLRKNPCVNRKVLVRPGSYFHCS